jgi:hypothetical protein
MAEVEMFKVTRYVRAELDGKLVVRRPGDRITLELAERLGLASERPAPVPPRPRRPVSAVSPTRRRT